MTPEDLKAWREKRGYTQVQLAHALGVHVMTVSKWERGAREIPPLLRLALEALEWRGGERKARGTKKRKEEDRHG